MSKPHVIYGVLPTGFVRRTFEELKAEVENIFITSFGPDVNLTPQSPQGQMIDNLARLFHESWEVSEDIYQSFDLRSATGNRLDIIAVIKGQSRRRLNESDEDFRDRLINTTETTTNLTEDLLASLRSLEGVNKVSIELNETNDILESGIPANSYSAIVLGGDEVEIANVIWKTHPAGVTMFGNTEVEIQDDDGFCRSIKFTKPEILNIEVELNVSFINNSLTCNTLTREQIVSLFLEGVNQSNKNTFGSRIFKSWVEGILVNVDNLQVESSRLRVEGSDYTEVINLDYYQLGLFTEENITINIV